MSNSWVLKALECIGQCVEVDPNKRPGVIKRRLEFLFLVALLMCQM